MSNFDAFNAEPFDYNEGELPLLVSMPHSGLELTPEVNEGLADYARKLPDTDWMIPELYNFLADMNVSVIKANYSRYVIDLNRPFDDEKLYATKTTGLFPDITFDDRPVFTTEPAEGHREWCKQNIWVPYHEKVEQRLRELKAKHGYAILFDAHSIAAQVPMLFEGELPHFNWGTNAGVTLPDQYLEKLKGAVNDSPFNQVVNGRFKGGYITRHYGSIDDDIHSIQLELSQRTYLSDDAYELDMQRAEKVRPVLKACIEALLP